MGLWVPGWLWPEEGQDLTEYTLLLFFIVIGAIAALSLFGGQLATFIGNAAAAFP